LLWLAACGSGNGNEPAEPPSGAACDPGNPATAGQCGTLLFGLTDADGDFLSDTVDVVSLTLTEASGATVEVLPATTRIDFADYVELTELVSASRVLPGACRGDGPRTGRAGAFFRLPPKRAEAAVRRTVRSG
jgi:hypothetical protein